MNKKRMSHFFSLVLMRARTHAHTCMGDGGRSVGRHKETVVIHGGARGGPIDSPSSLEPPPKCWGRVVSLPHTCQISRIGESHGTGLLCKRTFVALVWPATEVSVKEASRDGVEGMWRVAVEKSFQLLCLGFLSQRPRTENTPYIQPSTPERRVPLVGSFLITWGRRAITWA